MGIGIFAIDMISKEVNVGGDELGPWGKLLRLGSMDATHIVFKSGRLNLATLKMLI